MKALLELEDDDVLALLENDARLARKVEDVTEDLGRQDETKRRTELRRSTDG
ncbi:hypothetical protein [Amycolatopsis sulphurea]|uniref:hypothetical protein n=1 Tax=Amycolatopsis sulphurea TaxID=76022 RepID=UPI001473B550|nr:hypothetical protein [Amycolatopsis sulphurea]